MSKLDETEIQIPFEGMTSDGYEDDVQHELSELACFYFEDFAEVYGFNHLTPDDFVRAITLNFDPREAHRQMAKEFISALNRAVLDNLKLQLDLCFKTMRPMASMDDERWIIVATLVPERGSTIYEDGANFYKTLMRKLKAVGCNSTKFYDSYFNSSEIFFATSVGVDHDGFYAEIERKALLAGVPFQQIWPSEEEKLH